MNNQKPTKKMDLNSTLLFLHIPKTAGTSFNNLIVRHYDSSERFEIYKESFERLTRLKNMRPEDRKKLKLVYGHFGFGVHELLESNDFTYFTLLRHPIERLISEYYHVKRHINSPIHRVANKGTFLDFLNHRVLEQGLTNRMTRQISGYFGFYEGKPDADLAVYKPLPEEALRIAKKNMNSMFSLVGITDYFDETLLFLQPLLNWPSVYYLKQNIGMKSSSSYWEELDDKTTEFVHEYYALDIQLYNYALLEFEAKLAQAGEKFQKKLRAYRGRNRLYSELMRMPTVQRLHSYMPKSVQKLI